MVDFGCLNAISCANKSQSKVHYLELLTRAIQTAFSESHTHSLFLEPNSYACVCPTDVKEYTHSICMHIKVKISLFLLCIFRNISSFVVTVAVFVAVAFNCCSQHKHTLPMCMSSVFVSVFFCFPQHNNAMCTVLFVKIEPHVIISAMWNFQPVMYH